MFLVEIASRAAGLIIDQIDTGWQDFYKSVMSPKRRTATVALSSGEEDALVFGKFFSREEFGEMEKMP